MQYPPPRVLILEDNWKYFLRGGGFLFLYVLVHGEDLLGIWDLKIEIR